MPTAYNAPLEERDVSLAEFVWRCARAFGPCFELREASDFFGAPIPFAQTVSEYASRRVQTAEQRLAELRSSSPAAFAAEYGSDYAERYRSWEAARDRALQNQARAQTLRSQIMDWEPPSAAHADLQMFMLEQVDCFLKNEGAVAVWEAPERRDPAEQYRQQLQWAEEDLGSARRALAKAEQQAASNNRWLAELRASVPLPGEPSP